MALTLDDLERQKRPLAKIPAPTGKISTKTDLYHYWENEGRCCYLL